MASSNASSVNVVAAAVKNTNVSSKYVKEVEKHIPKKMKKYLNDEQIKQLVTANAYGIIEAVSLMSGEEDSPWTKKFKKGKLGIERVIPIFDLDDRLSETMIIFDEGYIIVDAEDGGIKQFSYDPVNLDYFDDNEKIYGYEFDRFAVDADGKIKSNNGKNGKDIQEVKRKLKALKKEQKENKWGVLSPDQLEAILGGYYGANEGTTGDFITDPNLWLLRYYPNKESGITNLSVTRVEGPSKTVYEINQDASDWPKTNDCAVISSLELYKYYWGTSLTDQKKAYNAIVASSYFDDAGGGVQWYHNDDIFKVGAEAIGKNTQSTNDDPYYVGPSYSTYKQEYNANRLGYVSISAAPYGSHTVTFKGYVQYKTTYRDRFAIDRTYYDSFVHINDHWSTTSTTTGAYLYLGRYESSAWYLQTIKPN